MRLSVSTDPPRNMRLRKMLAVLVLLAWACGPFQSALALDPAKAISQYAHTVWTTAEGLPNNTVRKILKTSDGYLWIGTEGGLARFDGVHFTVFDHTNTPAFHDDLVINLVEDGHGTLWISTFNGGVIYLKHDVFSRLDAAGSRDANTSLAADIDGSIWIGNAAGLTHLDNAQPIKTYTAVDGMLGVNPKRLLVDKKGTVWVVTSSGVSRVAGGKIVPYSAKDGPPGSDISDLYRSIDINVWGQNKGLRFVRDGGDIPVLAAATDVSQDSIRNAIEDRDGNWWIATWGQGLLRSNGQKIDRFSPVNGLNSSDVNTLYQDDVGNLWVGTNSGGLHRFRDGSFTTYATEEGLSSNQINSVIEDHAGDIWTATPAGINRIHGTHVLAYTTADGLPTNSISVIWQDEANSLWVGTTAGLVRRRNEAFEKIGANSLDVSGFLGGSTGRFWLATRGNGILRYDDGRIVRESQKASGLLDDFIFGLARDRTGRIWAGTAHGLNSIDAVGIRTYSKLAGLNGALVICLYLDKRNILWIGTYGHGFFRFKDGRFTRYTTHQGLVDDSINNIIEDADGNLWIGSNKGIFRITQRDLDMVAAGTARTVQPIVFGTEDGMRTIETVGGSQPSAWRAHDGRLWFPTIRGVVVVDPARLQFSARAPAATVEQMLVDEAPVSLRTKIRLPPNSGRLQIQYAAPSLSTPERTQFRYRLDGFDPKWILGTRDRIAQYTNLSPGHYIFHVGASTQDGRWDKSQEGTLEFDLRPHFYQTWWFQLLCVLAASSLATAAYRLRVNWLHARAAVLEERHRIAGEIHDSLAQGLSAIVFQAEAGLLSITRSPAMTASHLSAARDLAKSSLRDARYSVFNLSPPKQEQKTLLESLSAMAYQLLGGRVDKLDIHCRGRVWTMQTEAQHHIVLIVQEALSNSIQHGDARNISIDLTFEADLLQIVLTDDGKGFDFTAMATDTTRGYGLTNMRRRAARLRGKLDVTSVIGSG
ncbi:MAG: two-component regulator propeller domain-containing protein, partial [Pseudoxanthomonas sp.]